MASTIIVWDKRVQLAGGPTSGPGVTNVCRLSRARDKRHYPDRRIIPRRGWSASSTLEGTGLGRAVHAG